MAATVDEINAIREWELNRVLELHESSIAGKDLLEIGCGTGRQLRFLQALCRSAKGVEIENGIYSSFEEAEIDTFDGAHLPFAGNSFDVIFSSHVLEHVCDEENLYREMARVLRPGGVAIHVVPTHTWRVWTTAMHYPEVLRRQLRRIYGSPESNGHYVPWPIAGKKRSLAARIGGLLLPERHGEKGNLLTEHFLFSPLNWKRRLAGYGWNVSQINPIGLCYTGHLFFNRLKIETRHQLATLLGSSSLVMAAVPRC